MGAIVIRTRYDEGTESAEVATSAHVSFVFTILLLTCSFEEKYVNMNLICLHNIVFKLSKNLKIIFYNTPLMSLKSEKKSTKQ
jgi:hypothetical protein